MLSSCTQHHKFCFDILEKLIRFEYGHPRLTSQQYIKGMEKGTLTEGQISDYQMPGPFSFVTYLRYIIEPSSWGDQGLLTILSMMWQLTVTIVNAEDLSQIKIRHRRSLEDTHLVVVLAQRCHYLGTCKFCLFLFSLIQLSSASSVQAWLRYGARMVPYGARMVSYSARMVYEFKCGLVAKVTE